MAGLDLWRNPAYLRQIAGAWIVIKLALVAWLAFDVAQAGWLFWLLLALSVLVALRTYQQGKGEKGKLTWQPVTQIVSALNKAFYDAFGSPPRTWGIPVSYTHLTLPTNREV